MIRKMMTWGLSFRPGILRVTCPGDAKAVAAKAEERLGRGLGRAKITCNDTLIVFLWNIYSEVWQEKGTMNSGQDVFYSFELKPQLLEQPIQFLGVCPIFRNVLTPHSFTICFSTQSINSPCFSSIGCPYYPHLIISIRSPWTWNLHSFHGSIMVKSC